MRYLHVYDHSIEDLEIDFVDCSNSLYWTKVHTDTLINNCDFRLIGCSK